MRTRPVHAAGRIGDLSLGGARGSVSRRGPRRVAAIAGAVVGALATLIVSACAKESLPTEAPANGAPAQVVMRGVGYAGGQEYREVTAIDSATRRFTVHRCNVYLSGGACPTMQLVLEGSVLPSVLQSLFALTTKREFLALRASYVAPNGIVTPDPYSATLEVVRNGTRRAVTWARDATIPAVLIDFDCLLRTARGDLILCD